ncbi:STAS domain-containing protein [candidate division KSB1 bacterium]|nr:STAS domain-containing protein [candidate division KSB1 bacterium]
MDIKEEKQSDILILNIAGRIDANTSPALEQKMAEVVDRGEKYIVIDLAEVDYISSAGLRVFFSYLQKLNEVEGKLCYSGASEKIEELLDIVGFLSVFSLFKTKEDAVAHLGKS